MTLTFTFDMSTFEKLHQLYEMMITYAVHSLCCLCIFVQIYGPAVTRTLKGNEKQFELAGVRVSGSIECPTCHVNN